MASTTPRLGLTKPANSENYSVDVWNHNMEKIDDAVGDISYMDQYLATAGTAEFTLKKGAAYLVVINRLNASDTNQHGLYLVQAHSANSCVKTISPASALSSISISGLKLTIVTGVNYTGIAVIRLGQF